MPISEELKSQLMKDYKCIKYSQDPAGYSAEPFVNRTIGVDIGTLYDLCLRPVIYVGKQRTAISEAML